MVSRKKLKKRVVSFIPDELILEIVSRLSAEDVVRCRCVCKRWKDLSSSKKFLDLHKRRREGIFPLILAERPIIDQRFEHFLLDKWWEDGRTRSRLQRFPMYTEYKVQICDDGLVVLKQIHASITGYYIILNPMNGENVKFSISIPLGRFQIFGVFFHPSLKEYCTLWIMTPPENSDRKEYKFLNLGPNPCWRNIKSPVGHKAKFGKNRNAVSVDKYLYWMVDADQDVEGMPYTSHVRKGPRLKGHGNCKIIEFDVNSEVLTSLTAPIHYSECNIKLLNNGGVLSIVEVCDGHPLVYATISSLTDRPRKLWTTTIVWIQNEIFDIPDLSIIPIALANKQLVIFSHGKLFVCDLEKETIKKFGRTLNGDAYVFSHVMSLASLKGCKSEFCMGYMGEEKCDAQWFRAPRPRKETTLESKCSVSLDPARNEEEGSTSTSSGKASELECSGSHTK